MRTKAPWPLRYGVAVLAVAVAVALPNIPGIGQGLVSLVFLAVLISAWYGGLGPGLLATALIAVVVVVITGSYYHIPLTLPRVVGLVLFLGGGGLVTLLAEALQAVRRRADESRRWLSAVLTSIGDAVIAADADGRVTFLNPIAEQLTGWPRAQAEGRPLGEVFQILSEETRRPASDPVAKVLSTGRIQGLANHTVLVARDGTERPIDDSAAPIRDERGRLVGVVMVFRDVTDRRGDEERLRRSEERYRSLAMATSQTVWRSSADFGRGEPISGEDPVGLTDLQAAGGHWLDAVHPEDRERTCAAWEHAAKTRGLYEVEHRFRTRDGTYRRFLARAVPLLDPAGEIREWIGTSTDVTEARRAEEERERLNEELRENDRRKDEFLAMLAHELRNPLAAIANAARLARQGGTPEQSDWSLEVIDRQVLHLSRLIDDLLDVSRISRGKITLRRQRLEITPILDGAVATARPLIDERGHALDVAIDRGDLWAEVDPTRLEQVVVNLLTNAAKYSEDGGRIRLSAAREGGDVVVAVEDAGVGIPPELLPRLFDLFAQGDRSLARSEGGLGVGLTIVQRLVELHGGGVTAESDGPGRGSRFTVRLPAAERREEARPAAGASSDPTPPRPSRILVVDDNADTARSLSRLLGLLGHHVREARSGAEALEVARSHRPEFVLLDIGLPGMDGYEVASRLRRDESSRDAVIVAVTGYGRDEDRRRSREAGFDDHLVKPIDHDALLALLRRPRAEPLADGPPYLPTIRR